MDTLGKLMQLGNVSPEKIDWISSASKSTIGNQRILDYLLLAMNGESSMLELCDILEKLIEHPVLLKVVESLRNGKILYYLYLEMVFVHIKQF